MPTKPATLLDSNAGAPLHPTVREALFAFLRADASTGNPASLHAYGRETSARIADAEAAILRTLRAPASEWSVTFTGSGTEANQLAIRSALRKNGDREGSWAVSEVEHACVLELVPEMTQRGVTILPLKPSAQGEVSGIQEALKEAKLLSVIGVGNETGIFQQSLTSHILSAHTLVSKRRPLVHIDFVAGWGKAELNLAAPGAPDLVAIAGHKLGGLAGVGALIHRKSIPVDRPGTPNLAGIEAMRALADHWADIAGSYERLGELRSSFEAELVRRFPSVRITGGALPRVANVSHFTFPNFRKNLSLVAALDLRGFSVSAGSACASRAPEPSHVLRAMGLAELDARNSIRVSLHPGNTAAELTAFLDALEAILRRNEAI
jgi:cysteine desulfurase